MFPSTKSLRHGGCRFALRTGTGSTPRIVVFQPTILFAEAIEAVIHKYTAWQVQFATADLGAAIAAASSPEVTALLFESPCDSAKGMSSLIRRLRISCPRAQLILLSRHQGAGILRSKAARSLAAIAHFQDGVHAVRDALDSLENGLWYRSPVIRQRLKLALASSGRVRRISLRPIGRRESLADNAGAA